MTASEIQARITEVTTKLERARSSKGAYLASAADWQEQADKIVVKGVGKKKEADDKAYKNTWAQKNRDLAAEQEALIQQYTKELDTLNKNLASAQATSNDVQMILADQGKTMDALAKEAEGKALAMQQSAQITAGAEADAIRTGAAADAETKKNTGKVILFVGLGVGATIIIVILAVVLPKLKKKKKSKK